MFPKRIAVVGLAVVVTAVFLSLFFLPSSQAAATIFFDDFDDGYAGWSTSGNVASDNSPAIGANSVRLRKDGQIWRVVDTSGYTNISVTWTMAAGALENNEYCYAEVNTGAGWTVIASLTNGQDDNSFYSGTVNLDSAADNNPNFQIRYRIVANALGDYCYAENTTITGTAGSAPTSTPTNTPQPTATPGGPTPTPSPTPDPGSGVPGDPLTGSGSVNRTLLTYNEMINGASTASPVNESAFALPADAAQPANSFSGRLELLGEATNGNFSKIRDDYNYDADAERLYLPEMEIEFVQNGSHLIPAQRGKVVTAHPYWDYLVGPGRVWDENGDNGYSRAAFPFALLEKNANCTANGTMSFLFDNNGNVSKVWYQITQETCLYFKGDFWGQLDANYWAGPVAGGSQLQADYVAEVSGKMPVKDISQLAVDYPGFDLSVLTSGINDVTLYGMVVNGINYTSGCDTRYGAYAFCQWMRVPSYSTAKSIFAGMSLMRLAQKYGAGVSNLLIKDYVPEANTAVGDWSSVTFDNTLDMATGNYRFATYMRDEDGPLMADFFAAETYADRVSTALVWRNKTTPGSKWVYHTSDTFLLTQAMQGYLESQEGNGADIFEMLVNEIFKPLGLGPGAYSTLRTSENNWQGRPLGGYGLWLIQDDVAKIAAFLNNNGGAQNGAQLLDSRMLAAAMQQDSADRGLPTATQPFFYNNGFWGREFTTSDGYACNFWTPFMSGYGGITIAMMPNGSTFYVFSDNGDYNWYDVVQESHNSIGSNCQ